MPRINPPHTTSTGAGATDWMGHLHQLERYVDRYLAAGLAQAGHGQLKRAHLLLLRQLHGGVTSTELVHKLGITKQGISQLVQQLTAGGYVDAQPAKHDCRANRLYVSERGEAGLAAADTLLHQLRHQFQTQLGCSSYALFADQLAQLAQATKQ